MIKSRERDTPYLHYKGFSLRKPSKDHRSPTSTIGSDTLHFRDKRSVTGREVGTRYCDSTKKFGEDKFLKLNEKRGRDIMTVS